MVVSACYPRAWGEKARDLWGLLASQWGSSRFREKKNLKNKPQWKCVIWKNIFSIKNKKNERHKRRKVESDWGRHSIATHVQMCAHVHYIPPMFFLKGGLFPDGTPSGNKGLSSMCTKMSPGSKPHPGILALWVQIVPWKPIWRLSPHRIKSVTDRTSILCWSAYNLRITL